MLQHLPELLGFGPLPSAASILLANMRDLANLPNKKLKQTSMFVPDDSTSKPENQVLTEYFCLLGICRKQRRIEGIQEEKR